MFSACIVPPDSKETELGSSNQEASPSAGRFISINLPDAHVWNTVVMSGLVPLVATSNS